MNDSDSLKVESGINPNYRPKDYKALEDEFEIIKDSDKSFKQMLTLKHQPELKYSSHIGLLQFFECLSHFVDGLPFPDKFRETMKKMLMVSKMEQIGDGNLSLSFLALCFGGQPVTDTFIIQKLQKS